MSRGFQNGPIQRTSYGRGISVTTPNPVSPQFSSIRDEIRNLYGVSHHLSAAEDYVRQLMMANTKATKATKSHGQEPKESRHSVERRREEPALEVASLDEKVNSWLQNCTLSESVDVDAAEEEVIRSGDSQKEMIAEGGFTEETSAAGRPECAVQSTPHRSLNVEAAPFIPSPQWTPKTSSTVTKLSPGPMDHLETPSASNFPIAEISEFKADTEGFIFSKGLDIEKDFYTVILENLPRDCDEEVLRSMLEGFGQIGTMKLYEDNCGYSTARIRLPRMEAAEWMVSCLDEMHFDGYGEPIRAKVLN